VKVLIIGFGSIGKRHFEILNGLDIILRVDVVTKQDIHNKSGFVYKELSLVKDLMRYDYFIIATETFKHYQQLEYISSIVHGKKILVEKPLFDKNYKNIESANYVFVAYNLRFHPVLESIKKIIEKESVYYVNVISGQYLPSWRLGQDYRKSYSADIEKGGGVLRDLSHELDYLIWLFGDINKINSINTRISDLEISSDDIFTAIGVTESKVIVNVTVDYISKIPLRNLVIHTKDITIMADIVNSKIIINDKNSNEKVLNIEKEDSNYSYTKMHEAIINNKSESVCSYAEGRNIVDIIDGIECKEI